MNMKLSKFLDLLKQENLLEQLRENGTETRTEDWMMEKFITILMYIERIAGLNFEIDKHEHNITQIINTNPEIIELRKKIADTTLERKSLEVRLGGEQNMLDQTIRAKLEDLRKVLALKLHDDSIWVSLDVI